MIKFFLRIVPIIIFTMVLQEKGFSREAPNDTLEIFFPKDLPAKCGINTAVPIKVKNFSNIKSLAFSVQIDGNLLSFTSIGASQLSPTPTANTQGSNFASVQWQSNTGVTLADSSVIFELVFKPNKGGGQTTPLTFKALPTNVNAINGAGQTVPVKYINGAGSLKIVDDIPPVPTCPQSKTYLVPVSLDTILTSIGASVTDNCGSGSISSFNLTGATSGNGVGDATTMAFKQGLTNVLYTAKDDAGNTALCNFDVLIKKSKKLTIFASSSNVNCSDSIVKVDVFASDVKNIGSFQFKTNWDTTFFMFKRVESVAPILGYNPAGTGNSSFNITELNIGKIELICPLQGTSVTIPDNTKLYTIVLKVKGRAGNSVVDFENIDIQDDAPSNPQNVPVDFFPTTIKVQDLIFPKITCPTDKVVFSTSSGGGLVQVTGIDPVASDNCGIKELNFTSIGATSANGINSASGKLFAPGTTNVSYNVKDYADQTQTCTFKVIVNRLELFVQNDTVSCNDTKVKLKVRVKDFKNLSKLQFSVNFPFTKLAYVSGSATIPNVTAASSSLVSTTNIATGKLLFTMNALAPISMNDNDVLLEMTMNILDQTINNVYDITLDDKSAEYSPSIPTAFTTTNGKIYILDKLAPVISSCPTAAIEYTIAACDTTVTWSPITAIDNCTTVTLVANKLSGDVFPVGKTNVTYTFSDSYSNKSVCTFDVIIKDKIAPTFTACPTDTLVVAANAANCMVKIPIISLPVTDNCPGVTLTQNPASGTTLGLGVHNIILTAKDQGGNTSTCNRYIKVVDNTKPIFTSFPQNLIIQPAEAGKCGAVVSWFKATAADNCDPQVQVLESKLSGDFFNVGLDSVQVLALDASGNSISKFFKVKVFDFQPPAFLNCPNGTIDTTLYASVDCDAIFTAPILKANDNCINGTFDVLPNNAPSNNVYKLGKTILDYVAKDKDIPNQTLCQVVITVKDTLKPTITCPADQTISTTVNCTGTYTIPTPTVADNCTAVSKILITSDYSLNIFPTGTKKVTFTARDSSLNEKSCSVNITVVDKVAPTITNVPKDLTVLTNTGGCSATVNWQEPTILDNCKLDTKTASHNPNDLFNNGVTTVYYSALDKSGNMTKDSFKITVKDGEKPKPVTPCPSGFLDVNTDPTQCGATFKFPTFVDNCTPINDLNITINGIKPTSDFYTYPGTYGLQLKVQDASGNENTCGVIITIKDKTPPVVSNCPSNVSVNAVAGSCDYTFTNANPIKVPTFTDLCDGVISKIDTMGYPKGGKFPAGETILKFTAKDNAGNTSECSYKVIVQGSSTPIIDQTSCKDLNLEVYQNKCDTAFAIPSPTAIYLCANKANEYYMTGSAPNQVKINQVITFPLGETKVIFTAKNTLDKTATCEFKVTVTEKTKPEFVNFPDDVIANATVDCKGSASWTPPTGKDNCDNAPVVKLISPLNVAPGDIFTGTTTIVYQVTDKSGNSDTKSFKVIINDKTKPVITNCPKTKDITVGIDGSKITDSDDMIINLSTNTACDSLKVNYKPIIATDNCDIIGSTKIDNIATLSGKLFPIGTTPIKWIATDMAGNTDVCEFNIIVTPLKATKANISSSQACVGETVKLDATTVTNATYNWTGPNAFSANTQMATLKNITKLNEGKYAVNYSIGLCKSKFDTVTLSILSAPKTILDSFVVEAGKNITGKVSDNDNLLKGESFKVKLAEDISNPNAGTLKLNADGTFTFTAKNTFVGDVTFKYDLCYDNCPDACSKNQVVKIKIIPSTNITIEIPTLFTPNSDGINDKLVINGLAGKTGASLVVFSQWGEEVYRSLDYKNDWDGTWNGKNLPDGTYYYVFMLNAQSTAQKGFVNLFR